MGRIFLFLSALGVLARSKNWLDELLSQGRFLYYLEVDDAINDFFDENHVRWHHDRQQVEGHDDLKRVENVP